MEEEGDNYRMRMCSLACKLFDPLFLKGKQDLLHTLFYCADHLIYFGYPAFTPDNIHLLKKEIPAAVCHANIDFDWNSIVASSQFKTRMQKRMKRHILLGWRSDPGERAWKIWGWWQAHLLQDDSSLLAFKTALRLVVLTQTSSCAVERV